MVSIEFFYKLLNRPEPEQPIKGELQIFLRQGYLNKVMDLKNYPSLRALAKDVGLSHNYLSELNNQRRPVKTTEVMCKLARILGTARWESPFIMKESAEPERPPNHQSNNYDKMYGIKEYDRFSTFAETRREDLKHAKELPDDK